MTVKNIFKKIDWLFPLIARLSVGIVFAQSGWGKLHNIERVTAYFTELGIPAPHIQAYFVSSVELVAGALLVLGLFTRFVIVPLIIIMVVAILTAKKGDITSYSDILGLSEYLYIILMLWIGGNGAGAISIDRFIKRS